MTEETGPDTIVDPSEGEDTPNPAKEGHPADDIHDEDAVAPEPEVTEEVTKETVEEPEPEEIDQELVKQAMEAGVTKEGTSSLDNEQLRRVIKKLDTKTFSTKSEAAVTSDATETPVEPKSGKQYKLDVPEDTYEQPLIDGVEGLVDKAVGHVQAQVSQLKQQNQLLVAEAAVREERESKARFDSMISGLDKGYKDTFGEETPTRVQQANRNALRSQMRVEQFGREHEGLPSLRDEQLLEKALGSQHQNVTKQLAREEITSKLKVRKGQIVARPTNSQAPEKFNRAAAIEAIGEAMGDSGVMSAEATMAEDEEAMKIFD